MARGAALFSCCVLARGQQKENLLSRPLHKSTPQYVHRQQQQHFSTPIPQHQQHQLLAAFVAVTNTKSNHSSNGTKMGHLTSAVFLALCSAAGNAFLARAPQLTPGSAVRKQASTNARAPLAGFLNTRQLITGSAAYRIGSNGAAEMEKRRSRVSPLHDFKGVEVRAYRQAHCDYIKQSVLHLQSVLGTKNRVSGYARRALCLLRKISESHSKVVPSQSVDGKL